MASYLPDIGLACLVGAWCCYILYASPLWFKQHRIAPWLPHAATGMVLLSFICLVGLFILSDFSVQLVWQHSHQAKPLLYKITGSWGNHEGSFLLFCVLLALWGSVFACCSRIVQQEKVMQVHALIVAAMLTYVIAASNPFALLPLADGAPIPTQGKGLNPLLQDIGLAFHPPLLYVGYAGTALLFAFAIAHAPTATQQKEWSNTLRQYTLAAWSILTLGIALGSWWAYRELGWGGVWFWDPVENVSLLPWLGLLALLHSLHAVQKRHMLHRWTLFLALLSFALALLGFFLVRSGILSSVHSFAADPHRGMFLLLLMGIVIGSGLWRFFQHIPLLNTPTKIRLLSREGGMLLHNLANMTLVFILTLGLLFPLGMEIFAKQQIAVGAPYFNRVFVPIALVALLFAALFPLLPWGSKTKQPTPRRFLYAFIALPTLTLACLLLGVHWAPAIALSVGILLTFTSFHLAINKLLRWQNPLTLPRSYYAMALSHSGMGILTIALTLFFFGQEEKEFWMQPGDQQKIGAYTLELQDINILPQKNYLAQQGVLLLQKNGTLLHTLTPERRIYLPSGTTTTESSLFSTWKEDIYVVIGEPHPDKEQIAVRLLQRPAVFWIWLASCIMACGGLLGMLSARKAKHA